MIKLRIHALAVLLGVIALCLAPRQASAAPFCVVITGMTPECIYYDPAQCKYALSIKGLCHANPAELKIPPGDQRYCLVNGERTAECIYADYPTCDKAAARDGDSVCVDNGAPQQQEDPFRTEPGRRY